MGRIAPTPLPTWRTPGSDPAAFSRSLLGYLAEHVGGNGRPDGTLTAPLGRAGYRATERRKTARPREIVAVHSPSSSRSFVPLRRRAAPAFAAGRAARPLAVLLWEHDYGRRKRVAVIAATIARLGWSLQTTFGHGVAP